MAHLCEHSRMYRNTFELISFASLRLERLPRIMSKQSSLPSRDQRWTWTSFASVPCFGGHQEYNNLNPLYCNL